MSQLQSPGQVRRDVPAQSLSIQKMLDENVGLIHSLMAHQRAGALKEATEIERVLHRNLIYLATIADRTTSHPAVISQATNNSQTPSGVVQNNMLPVFVGSASSNLPLNAIVTQPIAGSVPRSFEASNTEVVTSDSKVSNFNHVNVTNSQSINNQSGAQLSNPVSHLINSTHHSELKSQASESISIKSNGPFLPSTTNISS